MSFECKVDAYRFASEGRSTKATRNHRLRVIDTAEQADELLTAYRLKSVQDECRLEKYKVTEPRARRYCTNYEFQLLTGEVISVAGLELFKWYRSTLPYGTKYRNPRKSTEWSIIINPTPGKRVKATNINGRCMVFNSVGECAKYFNRSWTVIHTKLERTNNYHEDYRLDYI